jgi:hypothetical protein
MAKLDFKSCMCIMIIALLVFINLTPGIGAINFTSQLNLFPISTLLYLDLQNAHTNVIQLNCHKNIVYTNQWCRTVHFLIFF